MGMNEALINGESKQKWTGFQKMVVGLLMLNAVLLICSLSIVAVVVSKSTSASIIPNVGDMMQANFDGTKVRTIASQANSLFTQLAGIDWTASESESYTITENCDTQYDPTSCSTFVGDDHKSECAWNPKSNVCIGNDPKTNTFEIVTCDYYSYDPDLCQQAVGIHGGTCTYDFSGNICNSASTTNETQIKIEYKEVMSVSQTDSENMKQSFQRIATQASQLESALKDAKGNDATSSLDFAAWMIKLLDTDFSKVASSLSEAVEMLEKANWQKFFCPDASYPDCRWEEANASIQVALKFIDDMAKKIIAAKLKAVDGSS